jgi:hypothetical protein
MKKSLYFQRTGLADEVAVEVFDDKSFIVE